MGTRSCIWSRTPAPQGWLCTGPKPCWTWITDGEGAVVSSQQQLACSLWGCRPLTDKGEMGTLLQGRRGPEPVLWCGGSFCNSPYALAVSQESQQGTWKGSPRPRLCRVGSASLSCLRLPRGLAHGCEGGSPGNLLGLEGLWVPAQHRGLGSQVWPQEVVVAVSLAMLNSYNSPPSSLPQVIGCEWLSLYVIFGILQVLFTQLTDSCYLFFRLEWFLFSCLDPDLHKKYEHSYFNLITVAKYLPKCLFLFCQTNRSKCICLQLGKLCFAHLTSAKKKDI